MNECYFSCPREREITAVWGDSHVLFTLSGNAIAWMDRAISMTHDEIGCVPNHLSN
jgi:hypothetical protein